MSTFGTIFRVTTFGESHCRGVGAIIDGCPPMMTLTEGDIQPQLTRRRPGQSRLTTPRSEKDKVTILSGTERGMTLGTPIGLFVANENVRPGDYKEMSVVPRPGHADYTYQVKYGIRAASGGGRSSARETIGRVAAGAVAEKWLAQTWGTTISTFVSSVGTVDLDASLYRHPSGRPWTRDEVDSRGRLRVLRSPSRWRRVAEAEQVAADADDEAAFVAGEYGAGVAVYQSDDGSLFDRDGKAVADASGAALTDEIITLRCPDAATASRMASLIREVKAAKDSTGGALTTVVGGVPVGLGEPCFDKLEAMLAHAMLSLPATKGFEIGSGFAGTRLRGSQHNDAFEAAGPAPTAWTGAADKAAAAVPEPTADAASTAAEAAPAPASASSSSSSSSASSPLAAGGAAPPPQAHPTLSQGRVLLRTRTNNAGGTLGGISNGAELVFRVAIKPVSTIGRAQETARFDGATETLAARGRHDPCVLPRAGPLVEGMTALVLADLALIQRTRREPATLEQLVAAEAAGRAAKRGPEGDGADETAAKRGKA